MAVEPLGTADERFLRQCAALRALLVTITSKPNNVTAATLVQCGKSVGLKPTQIEAFKKKSANSHENYNKIHAAIQSLITNDQLKLGREFIPLILFCDFRLPTSRDPNSYKLPSFLNLTDLAGHSADREKERIIIDFYAGCWRTYRVDSRAKSDGALISVGLLNIYPWRVLERRDLILPRFSFRQISQAALNAEEWHKTSEIHGIMKFADHRVTLLGWRDGPATAWPATGEWTWYNPNIASHYRDAHIEGVSLMPTSDGADVVGSYFVGEYIPNSDNLGDGEYKELIAREQVGFGFHPREKLLSALKADPTRSATAKKIERMLADSGSDYLLSHTIRE